MHLNFIQLERIDVSWIRTYKKYCERPRNSQYAKEAEPLLEFFIMTVAHQSTDLMSADLQN